MHQRIYLLMLAVRLIADPTHFQFKGLVLRLIMYSINTTYKKNNASDDKYKKGIRKGIA